MVTTAVNDLRCSKIER